MQKELDNKVFSFRLTTQIDDLKNDFYLLISFDHIVVYDEPAEGNQSTVNQTASNGTVTEASDDFVPFELDRIVEAFIQDW